MEALNVVWEFERFYEHFAIRRDDGSEMVELGSIYADADHGMSPSSFLNAAVSVYDHHINLGR